MSNSFLIFASILFAAFLGLSFIQVTKAFDPEHHGAHHGKVVNGFPIPELAVAGNEEEVTPLKLADRTRSARRFTTLLVQTSLPLTVLPTPAHSSVLMATGPLKRSTASCLSQRLGPRAPRWVLLASRMRPNAQT